MDSGHLSPNNLHFDQNLSMFLNTQIQRKRRWDIPADIDVGDEWACQILIFSKGWRSEEIRELQCAVWITQPFIWGWNTTSKVTPQPATTYISMLWYKRSIVIKKVVFFPGQWYIPILSTHKASKKTKYWPALLSPGKTVCDLLKHDIYREEDMWVPLKIMTMIGIGISVGSDL